MSDEPNNVDQSTDSDETMAEDEPEVTASTFEALEEAGLLDGEEPTITDDPDGGVDVKIRELVYYIVQSVLPEVDDIELEISKEPSEWTVGVHVPADFRGRVIGRHGRVARSIRNIVDAADFDTHRRISVDIVD